MKILLLEDDLILNEIIEEHLISLGYDVTTTYDGEEAQIQAYDNVFDMFILDVNVPNISGFEFLNELRERKVMAPAIFITSLDSVDDVEKGFNSGCNDYLKKPFELKELEIRINNLRRQFKLDNISLYEIEKELFYNYDNKNLVIEGIEVALANKESKILEYFIKNPNRLISVDELISNIWGYEDSPTNSTIRTYIKNIRKYLGEDIISNQKGVGYRFNKR